jgi:hypothetical protein
MLQISSNLDLVASDLLIGVEREALSQLCRGVETIAVVKNLGRHVQKLVVARLRFDGGGSSTDL